MEATGAGEGIVGLKEKYRDAVAAFGKTLGKKSRIRLAFLENAYPAGDEFVIVYETTGRVIPAWGGLHSTSAWRTATSRRSRTSPTPRRPVVSRYVTVAGAVRAPATFEAPIGIAWGS